MVVFGEGVAQWSQRSSGMEPAQNRAKMHLHWPV